MSNQRHGNKADNLEKPKQKDNANLQTDLNDANESFPGGDTTVPGKLQPNKEKENENVSPRGGKYNL